MRTISVSLGLWLACSAAMAQPDSVRVRQIGLLAPELRYAEDVCVRDSLVFVAGGPRGLVVLDLSDPANPVEIGACSFTGTATQVAVAGEYAYVISEWVGAYGGNASLRIISIDQPSLPLLVSTFAYSSGGFGYWNADEMCASGDHVYASFGAWGVHVVEVNPPASPVRVSQFDQWSYATGVAVAGDLAYVIDGYRGLLVFDVADPAQPAEVGSCVVAGGAYCVAVQAGFACVNAGYNQLAILSLADPLAPVVVGQCVLPHISHIALNDTCAFVACGTSGLRLIDLRAPESPMEIGHCETPVSAGAVALDDDIAYVADGEGGLRIIGVADPVHPVKLGAWDVPGMMSGVAVAGDYAFIAAYDAGLQIVDVTAPETTHVIGGSDTPGWAMRVTLAAQYAYVADYEGGLRIFDWSNPAAPIEIGFWDTPGQAMSVAVAGDIAYVADGDGGVRVIAVADPALPAELAAVEMQGFIADVEVSGGYAYVADGNRALHVLDLANPASPTLVSTTILEGMATSVAISGNRAYVTSLSGPDLCILDITNPAAPVRVSCLYDLLNHALDCTVVGDHIWVADFFGGLYIFDIMDSGHLDFVGRYRGTGGARGVAVSGAYAYVAAWDYFAIYDCSEALVYRRPDVVPVPQTTALHPAYPNPFNTSTTIVYDLPRAGRISLRVYDLLGREVAVLKDGIVPAESNRVTFDGSDLATGIYFARLEAGSLTRMVKLVLLK